MDDCLYITKQELEVFLSPEAQWIATVWGWAQEGGHVRFEAATHQYEELRSLQFLTDPLFRVMVELQRHRITSTQTHFRVRQIRNNLETFHSRIDCDNLLNLSDVQTLLTRFRRIVIKEDPRIEHQWDEWIRIAKNKHNIAESHSPAYRMMCKIVYIIELVATHKIQKACETLHMLAQLAKTTPDDEDSD